MSEPSVHWTGPDCSVGSSGLFALFRMDRWNALQPPAAAELCVLQARNDPALPHLLQIIVSSRRSLEEQARDDASEGSIPGIYVMQVPLFRHPRVCKRVEIIVQPKISLRVTIDTRCLLAHDNWCQVPGQSLEVGSPQEPNVECPCCNRKTPGP